MATKAEKHWLALAASLPCQLCGAFGPELHHIREGQGGAQRAGHCLVIPLCTDCHRGPLGLHGDKTMLRIHKTDEFKLLNSTISQIINGLIA